MPFLLKILWLQLVIVTSNIRICLRYYLLSIFGAVNHSYPQEQQHNALVVGQTRYRVDLSKIPEEDQEIHPFLDSIPGHKISAVVACLLAKIPENTKHKRSV